MTLHITFHPSPAGSLKAMFAELGRTDRVIFMADDLSVGPLQPADRAEWHHDWSDDVASLQEHDAEFWAAVAEAPTVTAWIGSRCSSELAGFHELVRRFDGPIRVLDVSVTAVGIARDLLGFGGTPHSWIIENHLEDAVVDVDAAWRRRIRARWDELFVENADLRVAENGSLVSRPISYFDEFIAAQAFSEWKPLGTHVARALAVDSERNGVLNFRFVVDRILELIETGVLEGDRGGEDWDLSESKVRRRS